MGTTGSGFGATGRVDLDAGLGLGSAGFDVPADVGVAELEGENGTKPDFFFARDFVGARGRVATFSGSGSSKHRAERSMRRGMLAS